MWPIMRFAGAAISLVATPATGRRFAWQNKPQFAIRRAGAATANRATAAASDSARIIGMWRRRMNKIWCFSDCQRLLAAAAGLASREGI